MKYFILILVALVSFDVFAKTGYVDMVKAIEYTKQGKKVKSKLEKSLAAAKKSMKSIENNLKKERSNLEKEVPLLSDEKRSQKIQQFQQKVMRSQQQAESKQLELKKLEDKLMNPVVERLRKVISSIAKKEGYEVVHNIDKSVLWVSPKLDLTKKVYTLFNKKYR